MRISSNTIFESNVAAMNQQQAKLLQTQQQIASGRRILNASDDPVAATRALDITQSDAINTQYGANRNEARHTLSLAESTLQSVTSLLQDVKTAAVSAGNGSLNNSDRRTIAAGLNGRLQELIGLANSNDGAGNYLFSGFQSGIQPFVNAAGVMIYNGDDGQRLMQVSASRQMASSDSGADIFMRVKVGNGTFATQAAAGNTGSGVISAGFATGTVTGDSYTVTFAGPSAQAAASNTGTGVISAPTVVTPASVTGLDYKVAFNDIATQSVVGNTGTIATPATIITPASVKGHAYSITADGAGGYAVQDLTLGVPVAGPVITAGAPDTIAFDGLQVSISGALNAEVFTVSAPTYNVAELPAGRNIQAITSLDFTAAGTFVVDAAVNNDLVTLTGVYANEAALVAKIQADIDADLPGALTVKSTGTVATGDFSVTIERVSTGAASMAVTVTAADAGATAKGIVNSAGFSGGASVATNQTYVSGQAISFGGLQYNIQAVPQPGDSFVVSSPGYTVLNNSTQATVLPAPPATGRTPYVSGQAISFGGMQFDISGAPLSNDQFTVRPSGNVSIFKAISDLVTALDTPIAAGNAVQSAALNTSLMTALNLFDRSLDNVLTVRSSLGLRLNEIDALQASGDDLSFKLKQNLSQLQDVDYNQAISDLAFQKTTLEAAQKSFIKVSDLSLFSYI